MPTIKGTASVADSRARQKALKRTKFPRNFGTSVNLEKVNKPVLTQWIEQKVTSILGFEDEIVSFTAINLFLPSDNESPDPRKAQLDLAGKFASFHSAVDRNGILPYTVSCDLKLTFFIKKGFSETKLSRFLQSCGSLC